MNLLFFTWDIGIFYGNDLADNGGKTQNSIKYHTNVGQMKKPSDWFLGKTLSPPLRFLFPPSSLSCVIVIGKQVAKDSIPCKFVIIFKRRDYFYFLEHMNYICRKTIDIVITFTHTHLQETGRRRQTG